MLVFLLPTHFPTFWPKGPSSRAMQHATPRTGRAPKRAPLRLSPCRGTPSAASSRRCPPRGHPALPAFEHNRTSGYASAGTGHLEKAMPETPPAVRRIANEPLPQKPDLTYRILIE